MGAERSVPAAAPALATVADATARGRSPGARGVPPVLRSWRALVIPGALLLAWEAAVQSGWLAGPLTPSLHEVLQRGWQELADGRLSADISASVLRALAGYVIGALLGMAIGFALGLSRWIDAFWFPTVNAVKAIALLAWIPLMSAWFGVGEQAKIAFIAFAACIPVAINVREGALAVQRQHAELAEVLRLGRWQAFRYIVFPSALPALAAGLRLGLIYAWLGTVGAEYFMTVGPGLGGLMTEARERSQMDLVLLGAALLGLIGYALTRLLDTLVAAAIRHWPR